MLEDWRTDVEPSDAVRDALYDATVVADYTVEIAKQYYRNIGWGRLENEECGTFPDDHPRYTDKDLDSVF
eukprot:855989-Prorocentrum_lima.AAC.1